MFLQWLHVDYSRSQLAISKVAFEIGSLLGCYYRHGQCVADYFFVKRANKQLSFSIKTPEKNSLAKGYANKYAKQIMIGLKEKRIDYRLEVVGKDYYSAKVCRCRSSVGYILTSSHLTTHLLSCIECNGFLPLYKVPAIDCDTTYNLLMWHKNYNACDDLQLNCTVLEHECLDEMYRLQSELNKLGLTCRDKLAKLLAKPVYYSLYRHYGSCYEQDVARNCPSCGGEWLLEDKWQKFYDFRCDHCHLVSNLASDYAF